MKTPLGLALLTLLAVGCAEDSLDTTPPAAVDVTGTWGGTWQDHPIEPTASGDLLLVLLQGQGGAVEGTLTMGSLPCVTTHEFVGRVTGLTLEGSVAGADFELSFFVDARGVPEETPSMKGEFDLVGAEACTVPAGSFTAGLDIVPLTLGEEPALLADGAGAWRGLWLPEGGPATPLALELETGAAGELHGLLELEGARLPLLGIWTSEGLSAAAPGAQLSARFKPGEALAGELALEAAEGDAPLVGPFQAAPRR